MFHFERLVIEFCDIFHSFWQRFSSSHLFWRYLFIALQWSPFCFSFFFFFFILLWILPNNLGQVYSSNILLHFAIHTCPILSESSNVQEESCGTLNMGSNSRTTCWNTGKKKKDLTLGEQRGVNTVYMAFLSVGGRWTNSSLITFLVSDRNTCYI